MSARAAARPVGDGSALPDTIEMVEVSPRDGLQNEARQISTQAKLELIARAIEAGSRRIEVTSFVSPRAVPQMADADEVCAGLPARTDVTTIGLVMKPAGGGARHRHRADRPAGRGGGGERRAGARQPEPDQRAVGGGRG